MKDCVSCFITYQVKKKPIKLCKPATSKATIRLKATKKPFWFLQHRKGIELASASLSLHLSVWIISIQKRWHYGFQGHERPRVCL